MHIEDEIKAVIARAEQDAGRIHDELAGTGSSPARVGAAIARELRLLRAELAALRLTMTASELAA
jgi:hypothetical protein